MDCSTCSTDTIFHNASTVSSGGRTFLIGGETQMIIYIYGTSTSRTLHFEGSMDGLNYIEVAGTNLSTLAIASQTNGNNEIWKVDITGLSSFRVRLSSVNGGYVTVKGRAVGLTCEGSSPDPPIDPPIDPPTTDNLISEGSFADNGEVLYNPLMGFAIDSDKMLSKITGYNSSSRTVFIATEMKDYRIGRIVEYYSPYPNFVFRGKAKITRYANNFQFVISEPIEGSAPQTNDVMVTYVRPCHTVSQIILWKNLEPSSKDAFDWTGLEAANNGAITFARFKNMRIHILFCMDYPTGTAHKDIPDWLDNLIAHNGVAYDNPYGKGFAPNYANTTLIAEHKRVIQALGTHYNNDLNVTTFLVGSVGQWGEFHQYDAMGFYPESVTNQYIQHYIDSIYGHKHVVCRRAFGILKDKIGAYNHSFGSWNQVYNPSYMGAIPGWDNGYNDNWGVHHDGVPNWRDLAPVIGEPVPPRDKNNTALGGTTAVYNWSDAAIAQSIQMLQDLRYSIGNGNPDIAAMLTNGDANMDTYMKKIGYRLFVSNYKVYSNTIPAAANSQLSIKLTIKNVGVSGLYDELPVELSLINEGNVVVKTWIIDFKTKQIGLGNTEINTNITLPSTITAGRYQLAIAIIDPITGKPNFTFAQAVRSDKRHVLTTINVT